MSGWFYMKEGIIEDVVTGPLTDDEFLGMAFDGRLKPKTTVQHEQHTHGQWTHLEQVPAAKQKLDEGGRARKQQAVDDRAAKQATKQAAADKKRAIETEQQVADRRKAAWQDAERQLSASLVPLELVGPPAQVQPPTTPFVQGYRQPVAMPVYQQPVFRCPYCGANTAPILRSNISQGGLIFAIVLFLFLCWPLFWIGLLMREDHTYCSSCNMKLT